MTFSIVAHCPSTGMLGVAVTTAVPAVGSMCPYVKSAVGAVSTQSWVNPYLAIDALRLMEKGMAGPQALDAVMAADAAKDVRQIGVVDAQGRSAAWTGEACTPWCGQIVEPHFAAQGNMLVRWCNHRSDGAGVSWQRIEGSRRAADAALEAGDAAGGDKRGRQSAAVECITPKTMRCSICESTSTTARRRAAPHLRRSPSCSCCLSSKACRGRMRRPVLCRTLSVQCC